MPKLNHLPWWECTQIEIGLIVYHGNFLEIVEDDALVHMINNIFADG